MDYQEDHLDPVPLVACHHHNLVPCLDEDHLDPLDPEECLHLAACRDTLNHHDRE